MNGIESFYRWVVSSTLIPGILVSILLVGLSGFIRVSAAEEEMSNLMKELEDSLALIDDTSLLSHYGSGGSGVAIQGFGGVALDKGGDSLVSNVKSIAGASSIVSDPTGFGFKIDLSGDFLFEFDKDKLTEKAETALNKVFILFKEYDGRTVQIEGHTDSKGTDEYNLDLSERRANAVKEWFLSKGIPEQALSTKGYGESNPKVPNTDEEGKDAPDARAMNRRVELTIDTNKTVNHLPTTSETSQIVK